MMGTGAVHFGGGEAVQVYNKNHNSARNKVNK